MKKFFIKNHEYWYRKEDKDKYILYHMESYFYIINRIVLDCLILLSKNRNYDQIISIINQKYKLSLSKLVLRKNLKKIYGVK